MVTRLKGLDEGASRGKASRTLGAPPEESPRGPESWRGMTLLRVTGCYAVVQARKRSPSRSSE